MADVLTTSILGISYRATYYAYMDRVLAEGGTFEANTCVADYIARNKIE